MDKNEEKLAVLRGRAGDPVRVDLVPDPTLGKSSESGSDLREKPDPNSALDKQPYPIVKKSHPDPAIENDPDPTF